MKKRLLALHLLLFCTFMLMPRDAPEVVGLIDPKDQVRATLGENGTVILSETTRNQRRFVLGHGEQVLSLAFTDDGNVLASGGARGLIKLWNVATGKEIAEYRISSPIYFTAQVSSLRFSDHGEVLTIGIRRYTMDHPLAGYVLVMNARSGEVLRQIESSLRSP